MQVFAGRDANGTTVCNEFEDSAGSDSALAAQPASRARFCGWPPTCAHAAGWHSNMISRPFPQKSIDHGNIQTPAPHPKDATAI